MLSVGPLSRCRRLRPTVAAEQEQPHQTLTPFGVLGGRLCNGVWSVRGLCSNPAAGSLSKG